MESAAIVLGLTALGGLALAGIRLSGTPRPPTWMALGHGAVAAVGLALLIYAAISPGIPGLAQIALGVFVLAALGGAGIFVGFHLKERARADSTRHRPRACRRHGICALVDKSVPRPVRAVRPRERRLSKR